MSERTSNVHYWIDANGADDPDDADLLLTAIDSPGGWGTYIVTHEGSRILVRGQVSTLVLEDAQARAEFVAALPDIAGRSG